MTAGPIKRIARLLVACVMCTALAACGSSSKSRSGAGSSGYSARLTFSECMRSHGVPNFPDPSADGAIPSGLFSSIDGIVIPSSSGINLQSPAVKSAEQSCQKLITGSGPKPPLPETGLNAQLKLAECMRAHGIPNYPDPTASGGGLRRQLPSDINPQSPAFEKAAKACGSG
jgi:hypothetical protein